MAIIREHNSAIARDAIVLNLGDLAAQGQHLRDLATNQAKGILDKANEQRNDPGEEEPHPGVDQDADRHGILLDDALQAFDSSLDP